MRVQEEESNYRIISFRVTCDSLSGKKRHLRARLSPTQQRRSGDARPAETAARRCDVSVVFAMLSCDCCCILQTVLVSYRVQQVPS